MCSSRSPAMQFPRRAGRPGQPPAQALRLLWTLALICTPFHHHSVLGAHPPRPTQLRSRPSTRVSLGSQDTPPTPRPPSGPPSLLPSTHPTRPPCRHALPQGSAPGTLPLVNFINSAPHAPGLKDTENPRQGSRRELQTLPPPPPATGRPQPSTYPAAGAGPALPPPL